MRRLHRTRDSRRIPCRTMECTSSENRDAFSPFPDRHLPLFQSISDTCEGWVFFEPSSPPNVIAHRADESLSRFITVRLRCQQKRTEKFPEFSRQEVCNLLMFNDNFESFDWTLISLRSLALALTLFPLSAGEVGMGCCPNPFRPHVSKSFPEYCTRKWKGKL